LSILAAALAAGFAAPAAAEDTHPPPAQTAAPAVTPRPAASAVEVQKLVTGGKDFLGDEKWSEAAALFEKARSLDPENIEACFGLGTAYSQLDRFEEAAPLLERVLKASPDSPVVKNNLAWVYAKATDPAVRNPEKAIRLCRDAVLAVPADFNVWSTLAESYYAAGNYERARRSARNAWHLSQLAGATNAVPLQELLERCEKAEQRGPAPAAQAE
jgi:predicted Zn-dependent protease